MAKINVDPVKYGTGQNGYYIDGNIIKTGSVVKLIPEVSNPDDDNQGKQVNRYIITGRSQPIDENKFWVSKGALLAELGGDYLNRISGDALAGIIISAFASASNDLGGLAFDGDLSDYDFTGDTVQKCSFQGCTMPSGQTTPSAFAAAVRQAGEGGFLDPATVLWTNGELLNTLL